MSESCKSLSSYATTILVYIPALRGVRLSLACAKVCTTKCKSSPANIWISAMSQFQETFLMLFICNSGDTRVGQKDQLNPFWWEYSRSNNTFWQKQGLEWLSYYLLEQERWNLDLWRFHLRLQPVNAWHGVKSVSVTHGHNTAMSHFSFDWSSHCWKTVIFVVFVVVVAAGDRQHAVRLDDAGGEQSEGNWSAHKNSQPHRNRPQRSQGAQLCASLRLWPRVHSTPALQIPIQSAGNWGRGFFCVYWKFVCFHFLGRPF